MKVMPLTDAIADAETLRAYLADPAHGAEGRWSLLLDHAALIEAGALGSSAAARARGGLCLLAYECAAAAASRALSVTPALRS